FSIYSLTCRLYLHSFPTRRSSDLEVSLNVLFNNGDSEVLSESYRYEQNAPEISLQGIGVDISSGAQSLILEIAVLDDTDVSFIEDRKSTRLNSSHVKTSYAVFCLK